MHAMAITDSKDILACFKGKKKKTKKKQAKDCSSLLILMNASSLAEKSNMFTNVKALARIFFFQQINRRIKAKFMQRKYFS